MKIFETTPAIKQTVESFGILNSACVEVNGIYYFTGATAVDYDSGTILNGPFADHAHSVFDNFKNLLNHVGLSLDHIVKVTCLLNDVADYPVWNDVFKARLNPPYPCRTTIGANLIVGLLEVEIIASSQSRMTAVLADSRLDYTTANKDFKFT